MSTHPEPRPMAKTCCDSAVDLSKHGWQQRYESGKTGWDRGAPSPMLQHWIETGMLQPCEILVPGCGRGHEVIALAEAGFSVTAIDFADSAVLSLRAELARRQLQAEVVQQDVFAYSPSRVFDAIYEQTCLCAIHPSQREAYEQLLASYLRADGQLFALFMQTDQTDGPPFACELSAMRQLFREPVWSWRGEPRRVDHPAGMHELACCLSRGSDDC